jgi:hypothetical protein
MTSRNSAVAVIAFAVGTAAIWLLPFPQDNPLLGLLRAERPALFLAARASYSVMLFTTPYIACSVVASLVYIFLARPAPAVARPVLPPYPNPTDREELFIIVGEVHHEKLPTPTEHPQWLTLPERGLRTGVPLPFLKRDWRSTSKAR